MARMQNAGVFNVVIEEIEVLSQAVRRIGLRPRNNAGVMSYWEGQFLSVLLPDGDSRCYSMAGPRRGDGTLELHVRLQPGGKFSEWLERGLAVGEALRIAGPFGDCTLKALAQPGEAIVMLATGTGAAPIKAMIERMLLDGDERPVSFYWGGYARADLYLLDYMTGLEAANRRFRFIPVLAAPDEDWTGRTGFVQEAAAADFASLSQAVIYACGAPPMVEAARRLLTEERGLPPENFHADPFEPSTMAFPALGQGIGAVRFLAAPSDGAYVEVAGRVGATLLETLRDAGLPVYGVCGGKKACGACRVRIEPPALSQDKDELRLLASLGASHPGDRLSCQVRLHAGCDGMSVRLPASPF